VAARAEPGEDAAVSERDREAPPPSPLLSPRAPEDALRAPAPAVASVPPAAVAAGLVAAAAAAVAWGLVAKWTGYELGAVAWSVGLVTGFAVLVAAEGRRGGGLQTVAVVAALLGIGLGKYLAFGLIAQQDTLFGAGIGLFSRDMLDLFRDSLRDVFGLYDLVWIALAIGSAWFVLRPGEPAAAPVSRLEEQRAPSTPVGRSHNPLERITEGLPHGLRVLVDWIVTIAGAVLIVLAIKAWVVNPYRIPSSSMEPTLHCAQPGAGCEARFSDRVLANRLVYHLNDPERGDIVVFDVPPLAEARCGAGGTFVKRLIALPGESWSMRDGVVYIDGRRLIEPYVKGDRRSTETRAPQKVAAGHYVMLGDNRSQSCDSRVWGTVPRDNIIGKVFATYWPPNRISVR
jgi:signal peptidase I